MASLVVGKSLTQIQQVWEDVRQEFLEGTDGKADIGRKAGELPETISLVLERIKSAPAKPEDKLRKEKAARVMRDVMKGVQLLGGLVATAAQNVFAPAGMCFNAIAFLIEGVTRMKNFHAAIADLFGKIEAILRDFKMMQRIENTYQQVEGEGAVPYELVMTTAKTMSCFVRICLLAWKSASRSKWKSIGVDVLVAFIGDDGGVEAEVAKLKIIVQESDSVKGTITLEEVIKTRSDLLGVRETSDETNKIVKGEHTEKLIKDRLEKLAKKLELVSKNPRDEPAICKEQEEKLEEIRNQCVPGTGVWLNQEERYNDWRSTKSAEHLLSVNGSRSAGKTFVAQRVIDDLNVQRQGEAKAYVAYYFFRDRRDRREVADNSDGQQEKAISEALCCMAYMLARVDVSYAKKLEFNLQDKSGLRKWPLGKLMSSLLMMTEQSTRFYMVIDGLEQAAEAKIFIQELFQGNDSVLLSATDENPPRSAVVESQSHFYRPKFLVRLDSDACQVSTMEPKIEVLELGNSPISSKKPINIQDFELFIDVKFKEPNSVLASLGKDHPELISNFRSKLNDMFIRSKGDFSKIESRFRYISRLINGLDGSKPAQMSDLEVAMLSDKSDDQGKAARQVINGLQTTLGEVDIEEINTILAWCMYGFWGPISLELADAVTALGRDPATLPIQKFSQKITNRPMVYQALFRTSKGPNEDQIEVQEEMEDWLRENESLPTHSLEDDHVNRKPQISLTISILQAEPKAVKRFLWDLHEKIAFDKSFFSMTDSQVQAQGNIAVNKEDAYSVILCQTLDFLIIDEPSKRTAILRRRLFEELPYFLYRASNSVDSLPQLSAIVSKLATFLQSSDLASFVKQSIEEGGDPVWGWMDSDYFAAFDKFLDLERISVLPSEQRRTLQALLGTGIGSGTSLVPITTQIGRAWLLDSSWTFDGEGPSPAVHAYKWIAGFLDTRGEWKEWHKNAVSKVTRANENANATMSSTAGGTSEQMVPEAQFTPSPPARQDSLPNPINPLPVNPLRRTNTTPLTLSVVQDSQESAASVEPDGPQQAKHDTPPVQSCIAQAADWVQERIDPKERSGTFLERLGRTFQHYACHQDAVDAFLAALESPELKTDYQTRARIYSLLAKVYKDDKKMEKAIECAEQWLAYCEKIVADNERSSESRKAKRELAEVHKEAKNIEKAITVLTELTEINSRDWEVHLDLLKLSCDNKQMNQAKAIFARLCQSQTVNDPKTQVSHLDELVNFTVDSDATYNIQEIVSQALVADSLNPFIESLNQALKMQQRKAEMEERKSDDKEVIGKIAGLHVALGFAYALQDRTHEGHHKGYRSWCEAIKLDEKFWTDTAAHAAANFHHSRLNTLESQERPDDPIQRIQQLTKKSAAVSSILAHVYMKAGQPHLARKQFRTTVRRGIELLSDDDDENDDEGGLNLAQPLACCGDPANALAAWSLVRPTNVSEENESKAEQSTANGDSQRPALAQSQAEVRCQEFDGPLTGLRCEGGCGNEWAYTDDFWSCEVCWANFCTSCLEKLKTDSLNVWVCHSSHSWLHNPPWSRKEYERVPKGSICVPRLLDSGEWSREQGEIMSIKEWKEHIQKDWGIE